MASVLCPSTEGNKSPFLHAQCGVLVTKVGFSRPWKRERSGACKVSIPCPG
jgi:hypothetical protein